MLCNDKLVYKRLFMYRDRAHDIIDIDEYEVGSSSLRPDHASKLLFGFRYQFFQENGTEKLKVTEAFNEKLHYFFLKQSPFKSHFSPNYAFKAFKLVPGHPLKVTGWFWKVDSHNRRYDDV